MAGMQAMFRTARVLTLDDSCPVLPLVEGAGKAVAVVWPGTGSHVANMNYVRLKPGEANVPHVHVGSEDTIFILEGRGVIWDFDNDLEIPFRAGQAVHVPVGVKHAVQADPDCGVVSAGRPSPADQPLLRRVGVWKD